MIHGATTKQSTKYDSKPTNVIGIWIFWIEFPVITFHEVYSHREGWREEGFSQIVFLA